MNEISAQQLKEKIESNEQFLLLDVRQPFEQYQANIEYRNIQIIPEDRLLSKIDEIEAEKNEEIVCMCRVGSRSFKAVELLEEKGFRNVKVLKGGINRWAKEIDNSLPVY